MKKITVLGDGGWGTTLAILLANKGFDICLWGAFKDNVASIREKRINQRFLPGIKLPSSIRITDNLSLAAGEADLIVLAVPSQFIRGIIKKVKFFKKSGNFISVIKGIETKSLLRVSEVIREELGSNIKLAVLSGPTIAIEVARQIPTACVISSHDEKFAKLLQKVFITDRFRIYTNTDVAGVELGGSLKNIIAIACGISDGLGFGANTKAAILSRGLSEMNRLGMRLGAKKETFSGLSGLGDLVTTCISQHSRNRSVGEEIGRGKGLADILSRMSAVAEGVETAKAGYSLSKKYGISLPITEQVYFVLHKNKDPLKAVNDLMTRAGRAE